MAKTGRSEEKPMSEAMVHGLNLESYVAGCYSRVTGRRIRKCGFRLDKAVPFFGANPDYLVCGESRLVEIKTAGIWAAREFGASYGEGGEPTDAIPDHYLVQCAWQLGITRRDVCDLAVLIAGQDLRLYEVARDDVLIATLRIRAKDWWRDYVEADAPPPLTDSAADTALVNETYPTSSGEIIHATAELDDLAIQLRSVRSATKRLESQSTQLTNTIKEAMGEAAELVTSVGKIAWKAGADGGSRRFCVYFTKETDKQ
jgi:predicted phage-related endonuclease